MYKSTRTLDENDVTQNPELFVLMAEDAQCDMIRDTLFFDGGFFSDAKDMSE
jgi:hypothetical protein